MNPGEAVHLFVAMPYGVKDGIDFDAVYRELIKPALEGRYEVFRADEELRGGDIRPDMFQELLLADVMVVDISLDNPNVWYELGVRHALRARGVVQMQSTRERLPFDVAPDRTLKYHLKDDGPDPEFIEADRAAIARVVEATISSWYGRKVSPVYNLLPFLEEPEWKRLKVAGAREFWDAYEVWGQRIEVARKQGRAGDILLLAGEGPTRVLRLEGLKTAGKALRALGQFALALEQFEGALEIDPRDEQSRQEKGLLLERLGRTDAAEEWLENLVRDQEGGNAETLSLLGRIRKDAWIASWRRDGLAPDTLRKEASYEEANLRRAIEPYLDAFSRDPRHYYSGINALSLMCLLEHLTGKVRFPGERVSIEGAIRWSVRSALKANPGDYWAAVTLGDLEVLVGHPDDVREAYGSAVASADKDWFALDSSRQQLRLLQKLELRAETVEVGIAVFDRALAQLRPPEGRWEPRFVFLFSGHMIDAPGRSPRFPPDKEPIAAQAIAARLDELGAGPEDLAICGGACGGDLLFAEHCLRRGLRLEVYIQAPEPQFLQESVLFAGDEWGRRWYAMKADPSTVVRIAPEELGEAPTGVDRFERNNLWQLYSALARGPDKIRFVSLWDRKGGDGRGGTEHMVKVVAEHSGQVHILDTTTLW